MVDVVKGKTKIRPYLDNYPFPYYLVLRSIESLPEVLSDSLTQWFEIVNTSGLF